MVTKQWSCLTLYIIVFHNKHTYRRYVRFTRFSQIRKDNFHWSYDKIKMY